MNIEIDRHTIIAFLFDALPLDKMSLVADAILSDEHLTKMYEEEKDKTDTHLFIDNELSPSQRVEFKRRLKNSEELSKEVNLHKKIDITLEGLFFKEMLEEAYKNYKSSQKRSILPSYTISRRLKNWLVAASIAVLLMFGAGVAYLFQSNDSLENRLYAKYYTPISYQDIYVPNSSSLSIAKQKYMDGEYTNALQILKRLPSSVTIEVERNMFIGLSFMEIGNYNVAANYFEEILANQSKLEYIPQVRWYLGLCYLKDGDKRKAIDTFRTIVDSNGYSYKKAKRILERLTIPNH